MTFSCSTMYMEEAKNFSESKFIFPGKNILSGAFAPSRHREACFFPSASCLRMIFQQNLEISLFTAKANLFATHASDWPIHGCDSFKICVEQEGPDVEESRHPAQESPRQQHTAIRSEQDLA